MSIIKNALESDTGPRYKRIARAIEKEINQGHLSEGTKLSPHRIMGDLLGVTSGTISRAYAELEKTGLVLSRIGDGTYVCRKLDLVDDQGFRNILESSRAIDLSRNTHIKIGNTDFVTATLRTMAAAPQTVSTLMDYAPEAGHLHHRQAGLEWLKYSRAKGDETQVICTNGAQHALLITLLACVKPGETVLTEQLSYPGLIEAARTLGIRLVGLEMDRHGLSVDALESYCQHHKVAAVYCTPTLQNPTTTIMPDDRRQALADVCNKYNVLIIEDDAHGVLMDQRPPAVQAYAPDKTILFSSLSKVLSAGVRVGYLIAPQCLISRLNRTIRSTCWMATPMTLEIASRWIMDGTAEYIRQQQRYEIQRRKDLVTQYLADLNIKTHPDCPHFWIEAPEPWRATEIEQHLASQNILVKSSEAFAVGRQAIPQYIRASISVAQHDDDLIQGFHQLQQTILEETVATW
ncbi:PLP-dependent aminotransferase family protein [Parendozoicomonas sp. Alg238-R29]|uniref:aminotransferase-like domain-containing protein n=1 Tax=Parendozoicomonas sp. Alg238-R29 TaxID=2993446 RepID=UPI00248E59E4|nr:PLP-dependent aminotransferase family protein [Parendozoicomonas sp. Alg238-R29]